MYYKVIATTALVHTSIMLQNKHCFMVKTFEISSLSNWKGYKAISLSIITLLDIMPPELTCLTTEYLYSLIKNLSIFSIPQP